MRRPANVAPSWATCGPILVGDGDDRHRMVSADRRARHGADRAGAGRRRDLRWSIDADFAADYRNPNTGTGLERACRTHRDAGASAPGCRCRLTGPGIESCRSAERRQHGQRHQRRAAAADAADRDRPVGGQRAAAAPRCGGHSLPARAPVAASSTTAVQRPKRQRPLQLRPGLGEHDPAGGLPAGRLVDLLPDLDRRRRRRAAGTGAPARRPSSSSAAVSSIVQRVPRWTWTSKWTSRRASSSTIARSRAAPATMAGDRLR